MNLFHHAPHPSPPGFQESGLPGFSPPALQAASSLPSPAPSQAPGIWVTVRTADSEVPGALPIQQLQPAPPRVLPGFVTAKGQDLIALTQSVAKLVSPPLQGPSPLPSMCPTQQLPEHGTKGGVKSNSPERRNVTNTTSAQGSRSMPT